VREPDLCEPDRVRPSPDDAFAAASCRGWLCVRRAGSSAEVAIGADEPVVAASVIKVLIAVAAESAFATGRLDPTAEIRLRAARRTPGPVGMSLYADDTVVSSRDLVSAMVTISDNVATDALLELVGLDTCNQLAADLGLADTVLVGTLDAMITSIARDAGFTDWAAMTAWSEAGPPAACARVRTQLARQLTRHRLAAGFGQPWRAAAKSGGLLGVVRNEIGVVERPAADDSGADRYYVAVFTRSDPGGAGPAVDAAIGTAAARAVASLLGRGAAGCAGPARLR
jgi:beta-lactamase class A